MKNNSSLKKNQKITLDISGFTSEGGGVGHIDGMAVFVEGGAKGDKLECLIIKAKKNYAIGKITKIIKPSKIREQSDCPVFPRCGGCAFRHISYKAELELKLQRVKDAFMRLADIDLDPQPIIGAEKIIGYRNKAQYAVRRNGDKIDIGFYAKRSHNVINCHNCRLQPSEFKEILDIFKNWIEENQIEPYDEEGHTGLLRHIYIRKAFATNEIMVCAVINGKNLPHSESLIDALTKKLPSIKSIAVNYNTKKTNVILGTDYDILWGSEHIEDRLCGIKVRLSPLSFYQINHAQAERLYEKAAEYAGLTGAETVLDLYCGAGTIGLSMADRAGKVIGVEIIPEAVEDAKVNAEINKIKNAEFLCADAATAAETLYLRNFQPNSPLSDTELLSNNVPLSNADPLSNTETPQLHTSKTDTKPHSKPTCQKSTHLNTLLAEESRDMQSPNLDAPLAEESRDRQSPNLDIPLTSQNSQQNTFHPDVIILDPPRKGCTPELLDTVATLAPERIVYVSCDPATLARDCAILEEKGYKVKEITPFDLFPHTAHVETVVLMSRQNP